MTLVMEISKKIGVKTELNVLETGDIEIFVEFAFFNSPKKVVPENF